MTNYPQTSSLSKNNVVINGESRHVSERELLNLLQTGRKNNQTIYVGEGAFGPVSNQQRSGNYHENQNHQ